MSSDLRTMLLTLDPADVGLTPQTFPHPVFAVVMESGFDDGYITLAVIADGTYSFSAPEDDLAVPGAKSRRAGADLKRRRTAIR